jgi:geranylgeranyl diphosphate synthase type II
MVESTAEPSSFDERVKPLRKQVELALERYVQFGAGCPTRLAQAMGYSLLAPGKRLRPILVLMAAGACGCDVEAAMPAACAVEMVHAYSLIHDDLPAMDDDDMRRGRPSCHVAFDEATAILAGDALLARAFDILAHDLRPEALAARCCAELARAAGATQLVGGQADDLAAEGRPGTLDELEAIHHRKTGAMLVVSLRLGGLLGEASDEQMARLTAYGRDLGLAFQIVDDLLDCSGQTQAMGKRTGQDQQRGKLTFPALLGEAESQRRASQLIDRAKGQLEPWGQRAAALVSLAEFVLKRNC